MKIDTNTITNTVVEKIILAEVETMVKQEFEQYRQAVQAAVTEAIAFKCSPEQIHERVYAGLAQMKVTILPFGAAAGKHNKLAFDEEDY